MFNPEQLARPCILRVRPYVPGTPLEEVKRELGLDDVVKLASNENPLGTSPLALQAMLQELHAHAYRYPESTAPELRAKLAERLGVAPDQIVIDNGEDGVISLVALTFVNPGDEVVMPAVSFTSFTTSTVKMDGVPVPVPLRHDLRVDVGAMADAITPKTKLVFLCNPNNPTGLISTRREFEQLLESVPDSALLVSDEAYHDFVDDPAYPQTLKYLDDHPNLLVLRSFSKIYGLAGLRVGYAIGQPAIIELLNRARNVFPVNRIAQAGAEAALEDEEFRQRVIQTNHEGRQQLAQAFEAMGLQYWPSHGNFMLVHVDQPSQEMYDALLRQGIIVRPQQAEQIAETIRISVGTKKENERAIAALRQALGKA